MSFPAMDFREWVVSFPRLSKYDEREAMKALKDDWAEIGARYAPGKEGKTKRVSIHNIVWGKLSGDPTPRIDPATGEQMVNGKGELCWDMSELDTAIVAASMIPAYEPLDPAMHYLLAASGVKQNTPRHSGRWIAQQWAKCLPEMAFIRQVGVVEAAHETLPPIEKRGMKHYTANAGGCASTRGRGDLFTGYEGQKMSRQDKVIMQSQKVDRLQLEWEAAKGADKKRLRGMLHTARKDLEDMEYALQNGGIMGRMYGFQESHSKAHKTTRNRAAAEKIKQEKGRIDYK